MNKIFYHIHPLLRGIDKRVNRGWVIERCAFSKAGGYCFFRIPKSANSTITRTLAYYDDSIDYAVDGDPATNVAKKKFGNLLSTGAWRAEGLRKYFLFTFVRNPYSRLLSAYLSKIVHGSKPIWQNKRAELAVFSGKEGIPSFATFVDYLEKGGLYADPHWCPQVNLIPVPVSMLSFVGKVETIDEDIPRLVDKLFGEGKFQEIKTREAGRRGASNQLAEYYTDDIKERVYALYKSDFETFQYPK